MFSAPKTPLGTNCVQLPESRLRLVLRWKGLRQFLIFIDRLHRLSFQFRPVLRPRLLTRGKVEISPMSGLASVSPGPAGDWDPGLYSKFENERTLAAGDLLRRVPLASARAVYDLGCGPGNSAELLLRRFAGAKITGLDTSEAMLAAARERVPGALFVKGDIADWTPDRTARPRLRQRGAAIPARPSRAVPPPPRLPPAGGRAGGADAVDGARVLARADAHGRGGGAVGVPAPADRQDATDDQRV